MMIVLTGGGTAGHVFPALSVAAAMRQLGGERVELAYIGLQNGPEAGLAEAHGIPFRAVRSGAMRGRNPFAMARSAINVVIGTFQARRVLREVQARAVLATGGYVTAPVALAARRSGIPVIVYLPDVRPGWAVRFTARMARRIAATNDRAAAALPASKTVVTGYPVRPEFRTMGREEARRALGITSDDPLLLVSGATQGARTVNAEIELRLPEFLRLCRIMHITGAAHYGHFATLRESLPAEQQERYAVKPFMADLPIAMLAADLAVMRSGASVLGELPAARLPAILVPYPFAGGHQRQNAAYLAERRAALVLEEADISGLYELVSGLLRNNERRDAMRRALEALDRPEAANDIARLVLREAGEAW